ncbi:MAG: hypothetical protein ACOYXT_16915 [Bacteroidota bacterium]
MSFGVFTGISSTYTWDEGINRDPRYKARYDVKFAPIGLTYGVDYSGFGFLLSPGIINTGQNYHVINTVGGHEGTRKLNTKYFNLPLALKLHLIDLSFFRVSFTFGGGAAILLKAEEWIKHNDAKFKFPVDVYPILPPDYIVEYDGVLSPSVGHYTMLDKSDFNSLQFFGFIGLRSDWHVTDIWKVSFDVRASYSLLESRTSDYMNALANHQTLYDIDGARRDISAHLTVGVSRYFEIDKKEKDRRQRSKGSSRKTSPKKYPWPSPKKTKPKG